MPTKSRAKKVWKIILSITIPIILIVIALISFASYRLFIYPNSEKAISDYLDKKFVSDTEIIEKLDSFSTPYNMESIDAAYLVRIKDNSDLKFVVYCGMPFKGMSHPFIPAIISKEISDNFTESVGNYVAKENNFPIVNNNLDINKCDKNVDTITDIAYTYVNDIDKLLKQYDKDYMKFGQIYCEYLSLCNGDNKNSFYLTNTNSKEEIRENVRKTLSDVS